jgi:hypothetical protein
VSTGPTCQLSFQKSYRTNKILIVCVSLDHLRLFFSEIIISKNILNNYYYYYRSISQLFFDPSISMDSLFSLHWLLPSPSLDIFTIFFASFLPDSYHVWTIWTAHQPIYRWNHPFTFTYLIWEPQTNPRPLLRNSFRVH